MNSKSSLRLFMMLLLAGLLMVGLTSCKLPASQGPISTKATSVGFPVPGETEPTSGGIDISTFATQTAQAIPPVVNASPSPAPAQDTSTPSTSPEATKTSVVPAVTSTPITYVLPTPGTLPSTYTLQQGEYIFCIARRFDLNQGELLKLNGLTPDSLLSPGQEIKIPQTGNPFEGDRSLHDHPSTYIVDPGDTIGSIACYYGDVSPEMIILQNDLSSDELTVGTELVIP